MKTLNLKWLLVIFLIVSTNFMFGQKKSVLKYNSSNFDYENSKEILYTKYETTYHTFDFINKTITLKGKLGTNQWQTMVYKWSKINDPYGNGYVEFTITNDKSVYQIWRSAANNIGYEMRQGTKFVFYDVKPN